MLSPTGGAEDLCAGRARVDPRQEGLLFNFKGRVFGHDSFIRRVGVVAFSVGLFREYEPAMLPGYN